MNTRLFGLQLGLMKTAAGAQLGANPDSWKRPLWQWPTWKGFKQLAKDYNESWLQANESAEDLKEEEKYWKTTGGTPEARAKRVAMMAGRNNTFVNR